MKLIDKAALVAEIKRRLKFVEKRLKKNNSYSEEGNAAWERDKALYDAYNSLLSFLNTLEVKEVSEELAETYMQVFEKKFPILPTLKGKQLDKFKNFLNKCQQIFGLQEFGIRPVQAKLFEKLALLWAAWGAENLQGIGKIEGESDVVKEVDLETEEERIWKDFNMGEGHLSKNDLEKISKHFFKLGLKAQKGE